MASRRLKLGLLGGTFNPIHCGHLRAAEEMVELMSLDRVLFIPAAQPPHKDPWPVVSFAHRLAMTRAATLGRPGFGVSDLEGRRDGPSYTVETLLHLHRHFGPDLEPYFLTGLDAFLEVPTWKEYQRLFDLTHFVVLNRPGSSPRRLGPLLQEHVSRDFSWDPEQGAYLRRGEWKVYFRKISRLDISSTDIRRRLAQGRSIRFLVPEGVRLYIRANGLYQPGAPEEGPPA